ncbi:hypothetical protein DB346_08170 [Verrucomicrobia bacterium LW23]|nr:hypothetical protein DB346_08170 [Verrucomicrobia bacterium LW23]
MSRRTSATLTPSFELQVNTRSFEAALLDLYGATRRDMTELLREQARGFIRQVVLITPPGGGSVTGVAARARGNLRIEQDIRRVFRELRHEKWTSPEIKDAIRKKDLAALREIILRIPELAGMEVRLTPETSFHQAARGSRGTVSPRRRPNVLVLDGLGAYIREQQKRVGMLASGWNAAAEALGVKLPAWVARHGNSRGSVLLQLNEPNFSIRLANDVPFAGNTRDLTRRVQWALDRQASGTQKRVEFILAANARKAAFKPAA